MIDTLKTAATAGQLVGNEGKGKARFLGNESQLTSGHYHLSAERTVGTTRRVHGQRFLQEALKVNVGCAGTRITQAPAASESNASKRQAGSNSTSTARLHGMKVE